MEKNIVKSIDDNSPLSGLVGKGDKLLSINGKTIEDVLDYKYYSYDAALDLEFDSGCFHVDKAEGEDLGIDFETYLMDTPKSCANNCIFCFIDQLPQGMRKTMYFKDDDARLSFLLGNYITLTNLSDREIQRIIDLHISPVNVSVHTMNRELRVKMLRNKNAGKSIDIMKRLADAGIVMNCQIVCCPGINDGTELQDTMRSLYSMYPQVNSVSVVPLGMTRFREGLTELEAFSEELSRKTIEEVTAFGDECRKECGSRVFFCGDEMYLKAGLEIPNDGFYEDYCQLENGVGMLRLMETEFMAALRMSDEPGKECRFSIACGTAVGPFFEKLVCTANGKYDKIKGKVFPIENDFFGHSITVSGLVTGQDLIRQLKGRELGDALLISQNMLRREEMDFLDDVKLGDAENELGVRIIPVEQDGFALYDAMCGIYNSNITEKYGEYLNE